MGERTRAFADAGLGLLSSKGKPMQMRGGVSRPNSGIGKRPLEAALCDTPPWGAVPQALASYCEITDFELDSSRSYAKKVKVECLVVLGW